MDDELKDIWQEASKKIEKPTFEVDFTKKPLGVLSKIERNLQWEQYGNYTLAPLATLFLAYEGEYGWAVFLGIFTLLAIIYYHQVLKKIKSVHASTDVKHFLKDISQLLNRFSKHYKIVMLTFTVLSSIYGFVAGFSFGLEKTIRELELDKPLFWFTMVAYTALAIWLINKFVDWLYAKKIRQLDEMVKSMEED